MENGKISMRLFSIIDARNSIAGLSLAEKNHYYEKNW
jgi:hypothetical protein